MKTFLNEKTRQGKIIEKRNLFGLGLTSLIAACAADDAAKDTTETKVDHGTIPQTDLKLAPLTAHAGGTAAITPTNPDGADSRAAVDAVAYDAGPPEVLAVDAVPAKKDLKIDIAEVTGVVTSSFTATFKNGDHQTAAGTDGSAQATVYTDLTTGSDLVVSSSEFGTGDGNTITGAIYIVWDMAATGTIADVDAVTTKLLKVAGLETDVISATLPEFHQIGGVKVEGSETGQPDMVFQSVADGGSATNINVLWDVTKHAGVKKELTVESNEILQVKGVGVAPPEFTKINNNEDYDMLVKGAGNTADTAVTYILWDVANYHNAEITADTEQAVVDLAGADATAINASYGLLTIKGLTEDIMKGPIKPGGEIGYTDIDGKGINDLAFVYDNNTYILFGEKVANRDTGKKAISHAVDLTEVAGGAVAFYDKDGKEVTLVADGEVKAGFFHFDLDGQGGNDIVANVGYRFNGTADLANLADITAAYGNVITPPPADAPTLSEEAYWDIA